MTSMWLVERKRLRVSCSSLTTKAYTNEGQNCSTAGPLLSFSIAARAACVCTMNVLSSSMPLPNPRPCHTSILNSEIRFRHYHASEKASIIKRGGGSPKAEPHLQLLDAPSYCSNSYVLPTSSGTDMHAPPRWQQQQQQQQTDTISYPSMNAFLFQQQRRIKV